MLLPRPVLQVNLNYAIVLIGGTTVLAMIAWAVSARKWFKGPVRNVDQGQRTETLAEAAMKGELDETDSAFGTESGEADTTPEDKSAGEEEPTTL